jgi:hypothetical protein
MAHKLKNKNHQELQPEFPGAPIWGEWLEEKRDLKKREVGLFKRLGRGALEAAAVVVMKTDQYKKTLSADYLEAQKKRVERIPSSIEWTNRQQEKLNSRPDSRIPRLGAKALTLAHVVNKRAYAKAQRNIEKVETDQARLSKRDRTKQRRGPITRAAYNYAEKIVGKKQERHQERGHQYHIEKQQAWDKHLIDNPEVAENLRQKKVAQSREYEAGEQTELYVKMRRKSQDTVNKLNKRNLESFIGTLPRPKEMEKSGMNYDDLAISTVKKAMTYRQRGGSINLLDNTVLNNEVDRVLPLSPHSYYENTDYKLHYNESGGVAINREFRINSFEASENHKSKLDYSGGVGVALWKMGLVDIPEDRLINYGHYKPNPEVQWERNVLEDGQQVTYASIPFNPENELHQMVAGENADTADSIIRVAISGYGDARPNMPPPAINLNLVPAPSIAEPIPVAA